MTDIELERTVDLWKTTVTTQQHFNSLQLQLRNFALTLFVAVLSVTGYAAKEHTVINILSQPFPVAPFICIVGFAILFGFYSMDWGYHRLLKGAQDACGVIEASLKSSLPTAVLSECITKASSSEKFLRVFSSSSTTRLHWFYRLLLLALVISGILGCFTTSPATAVKTATVIFPHCGIEIQGTQIIIGPDSRFKVKVQRDAVNGNIQTIEATPQ